MGRRVPKLALIAAFLLPTLSLAWLGFAALRSETERGTERYRAQAESLIDEVLRRIAAAKLAILRGDEPALPVAFGPDGAWRGPTLARVDDAAPPALDPLLIASLSAEVDRLEAAGELERALERMRLAASGDDDPERAAWALETRAALATKLGRNDLAVDARRELVERFPRSRGSQGLVRAFGARRELARASPARVAEIAALYADAVRDHVALEETATAWFVRSLRLELGEALAREPDAELAARVDELDRADAANGRLRRWLAALPRGASDWIASGAEGGARTFALPDDPITLANPNDRALVAVERAGDEWRGGALELSRLFADAGAGVAEEPGVSPLGFVVALQPVASAPREPPIARRRLAAPLDDWEARIGGGDFAGFLDGERRKLYWTGALVAGVLALALVAAFATLRAVAREVEAARGREAFVAAVTHELKAPLAAIRLFAEVFERGDVEPEKVREFGARTVRESDRLARLVDTVLDLARLEHAGASARREALELGEIAESALAAVEPLARERGFELALSRARDVPVAGDRDALCGAIVNLLDNALKYSDAPHEIEVEVARAGEHGEVRVLDRGRGVAEGERRRVFEPFHRVGDELTRDRPGVGLGLALVAKIAEAHGGGARCEARDGGGSVFVLSLPLRT